jgi:predicted transcriptional regulator of viral defense system
VCEVINSKKDLEMLVAIRDMFTYAKIEVVLSPTEVAKRFNVSKQKVVTLIAKMTKVELLLRVSKGVYRLNPYMFLPFKSDGELLQQEWKRLVKRLEPEVKY